MFWDYQQNKISASLIIFDYSMSDIFPPNMSPIYPHVTTTPRLHGSPASLQAIFEEAINQHIEEYTATRDRDRVPTEGTSSSSSSEPQSQADESRPESEGGSSVILGECFEVS